MSNDVTWGDILTHIRALHNLIDPNDTHITIHVNTNGHIRITHLKTKTTMHINSKPNAIEDAVSFLRNDPGAILEKELSKHENESADSSRN